MCQRVLAFVLVLLAGSILPWASCCNGAIKSGSASSSSIDSGLGTRFADGNASARVLSYSSYYDEQNALWTVGEVENTGDVAIAATKVETRYYNASNELVYEFWCFCWPFVLLPGRKSPFYDRVDQSVGSLKIHNCTMTVSSDDLGIFTQEAQQCLEIVSNSSQLDWRGDLHVVGKIRNLGEDFANYTKVYATLYDGNGTVAGYGEAVTNPTNLAPNETGTFDINKYGGGNWLLTQKVGNVASFSVIAEAYSQYTEKQVTAFYVTIPEYTTILVPLSITLSLITALTLRFSSKSGRRARRARNSEI